MFKIASKTEKPNGIVSVSIEGNQGGYSYFTRDISTETASQNDEMVIDYIVDLLRDEFSPNYLIRVLQKEVAEVKELVEGQKETIATLEDKVQQLEQVDEAVDEIIEEVTEEVVDTDIAEDVVEDNNVADEVVKN